VQLIARGQTARFVNDASIHDRQLYAGSFDLGGANLQDVFVEQDQVSKFDEASNLLLGTDEDPATKRLIAWVDPRAQPGNYTTHYGQQSLPVALQAGRRYYVEVLHHEANLIDHLSVQWRLPARTTETPRCN
jgi:hypothetical protein